MAAVQFGPRRSGRAAVSDSNTSVALGACGACSRSNSATSGAGSAPTMPARVRRCPRA